MSDLDERTQPATPRRREEARARGEVARSADLSAAIVLLGGLIALEMFGEGLFASFANGLRAGLGGIHEVTAANAVPRLAAAAALAWPAAPIVAFILAAAVAAGLVQSGMLFTLEPIAPKGERLLPRLERIFSPVNAIGAVLRFVAVAGATGITLWSQREAIFVGASPAVMASVAAALSLRAVIALLAIGILDYAVRRWQHERKLRMTPSESREEMRRYEGDPQLRARRRTIQRRLAQERMVHLVQRATVVMTDDDRAVAIEYGDAAGAPRVVAKGSGELARQIIERARESNVPILESADTANVYRLSSAGEVVAPELYRPVADAVARVMTP